MSDARRGPAAFVYTGIYGNGELHGPHLCWRPSEMDAMSESMGARASGLYRAPSRDQLEAAARALSDRMAAKLFVSPEHHWLLNRQDYINDAKAVFDAAFNTTGEP